MPSVSAPSTSSGYGETEGMIGYIIEQELGNLLDFEVPFATLLTQVEVDANDPAFQNPTKPIGPVYAKAEAEKLAAEFPPGKMTTCRVNPRDPDFAVLKPDSLAPGYSIWFPGLFVVGGLGIALRALVSNRGGKREKTLR